MGLTTLFTDEPYIFCKASKKLDVENSLDKRNLNVSSKRSSLEIWSWIVDSFSIWKSKFSCTCWKKIIKNYNFNNKSSLLIAVNTKLALKKKGNNNRSWQDYKPTKAVPHFLPQRRNTMFAALQWAEGSIADTCEELFFHVWF